MSKITWQSKSVLTASIDPTPGNYKIKSDLGRERLKQSLAQFGMAGNAVVNYSSKRGRYDLIDGNSRWEQAKERKEKRMWVSLPSRKLTPKEFREMSAMFDFAKAGEVDVDRIEQDLGTSKDFYNRWGLLVPPRILETLGKGQQIVTMEKRIEQLKEDHKDTAGSLRKKFIEPPFSVLDARNGNWQARKVEWLSLGIQSELGRDGELIMLSDSQAAGMGKGKFSGVKRKGGINYMKDATTSAAMGEGKFSGINVKRAGEVKTFNLGDLSRVSSGKPWAITGSKVRRTGKLSYSIPLKKYAGKDQDEQAFKEDYYSETNQKLNTSVFDPALTELMYVWFCPKKGTILDPFAGGSVRGIVAHYLNFKYWGIDLSRKQIEANRKQGADILKRANQPTWYVGDSDELLKKKWVQRFDFLFSCPPYVDLERYSDDPRDLSTLRYKEFLIKYESIIARSLALLKPKRYACFVVSEVRDKRGYYYDFVGDTKKIFIKHGAFLYNDAVLLNMVGSASMRADRQFTASKKLVRTHQNVLVFYKP